MSSSLSPLLPQLTPVLCSLRLPLSLSPLCSGCEVKYAGASEDSSSLPTSFALSIITPQRPIILCAKTLAIFEAWKE